MTNYLAALAAEATDALAYCESRLDEAVEAVRSLQEERTKVLETRAAAQERQNRLYDELTALRAAPGDNSRREEKAEREDWATERAIRRADRYLESGELDAEYRKAVARQMAGLLREDARRRLKGIRVRSDNPELLKTVAECDDGVLRAARYVINMFPLASQLHSSEVNKAHAEARDRLGFSD